jgi:hypothetical protein
MKVDQQFCQDGNEPLRVIRHDPQPFPEKRPLMG